MNKLEAVVRCYYAKNRRPLVMIVNNIHYFSNNEDGHSLLLQLQQHAEEWAADGMCCDAMNSCED
jgi:hypothetical protein